MIVVYALGVDLSDNISIIKLGIIAVLVLIVLALIVYALLIAGFGCCICSICSASGSYGHAYSYSTISLLSALL